MKKGMFSMMNYLGGAEMEMSGNIIRAQVGDDSEVIERGEGEMSGAIEFGGFSEQESFFRAVDNVSFDRAGASGMRLSGVELEIDGGGGDESDIWIELVNEIESEGIREAVASGIDRAARKKDFDMGIAA